MNLSANANYAQQIKSESRRLGFDYCGISKADFLEEEAPRLENWLNNNMHGQMSYMQNHFDKRLDPRLLVPGAKSVISLLLNYYPSEKQKDETAPKINTVKATKRIRSGPKSSTSTKIKSKRSGKIYDPG